MVRYLLKCPLRRSGEEGECLTPSNSTGLSNPSNLMGLNTHIPKPNLNVGETYL